MEHNWIPVGPEGPPEGDWLVYLKEPLLKMRIHAASYAISGNNVKFGMVGGLFEWDAPTVTHYCDLPEEPKVEGK